MKINRRERLIVIIWTISSIPPMRVSQSPRSDCSTRATSREVLWFPIEYGNMWQEEGARIFCQKYEMSPVLTAATMRMCMSYRMIIGWLQDSNWLMASAAVLWKMPLCWHRGQTSQGLLPASGWMEQGCEGNSAPGKCRTAVRVAGWVSPWRPEQTFLQSALQFKILPSDFSFFLLCFSCPQTCTMVLSSFPSRTPAIIHKQSLTCKSNIQ